MQAHALANPKWSKHHGLTNNRRQGGGLSLFILKKDLTETGITVIYDNRSR
jgi:hypothetical protein